MAPGKPLAYQGVSSDIEKLKTRNVDLSGLLERPANPAHQNGDDSLERSYEFVRVARAALRSAANGEVDEAGARVESVRDALDGIIADLETGL